MYPVIPIFFRLILRIITVILDKRPILLYNSGSVKVK